MKSSFTATFTLGDNPSVEEVESFLRAIEASAGLMGDAPARNKAGIELHGRLEIMADNATDRAEREAIGDLTSRLLDSVFGIKTP